MWCSHGGSTWPVSASAQPRARSDTADRSRSAARDKDVDVRVLAQRLVAVELSGECRTLERNRADPGTLECVRDTIGQRGQSERAHACMLQSRLDACPERLRHDGRRQADEPATCKREQALLDQDVSQGLLVAASASGRYDRRWLRAVTRADRSSASSLWRRSAPATVSAVARVHYVGHSSATEMPQDAQPETCGRIGIREVAAFRELTPSFVKAEQR